MSWSLYFAMQEGIKWENIASYLLSIVAAYNKSIMLRFYSRKKTPATLMFVYKTQSL